MPRGVSLCLLAACLAFPAASPAAGLQTGFIDQWAFSGDSAEAAFARAEGAGATTVRLVLYWRSVAPVGATKPTGFAADDPGDPAYQAAGWKAFDTQVKSSVANGLRPIVSIQVAPDWAEGPGRASTAVAGTWKPSPAEFGAFARAAATRYSGEFADPASPTEKLPRVRDWMAWNEPNRDYYLMPQYVDGALFSAKWYRYMVNAFADAVHAVRNDNRVIAGGLAPLGRPGKPAPMAFMRKLLCMSNLPYRSVCTTTSRFDVWSHHPYTSGGPTHRAYRADDVALGDLPEMKALLTAATRAGHIVSYTKTPKPNVPFWITEVSWDSNPPDPQGVPAPLHARWVSEMLYRAWSIGIPVVTWFLTTDHGLKQDAYQSGLFFLSGDRKLSWRAFRFPFVAFAASGRIRVWGRTPTSESARIFVERSTSNGWTRMGTIDANAQGIFSSQFISSRTSGLVRARIAYTSDASLGFSLVRPPDRYVNPFGCGGSIPC